MEESKEVQNDQEGGETIRVSVKLVGRYVPPLKKKLFITDKFDSEEVNDDDSVRVEKVLDCEVTMEDLD